MADWTSEYITQIEDCEKRQQHLTEWETTFLDSVKKQIEDGRRPSPKQIEILDRCWEKATSRG